MVTPSTALGRTPEPAKRRGTLGVRSAPWSSREAVCVRAAEGAGIDRLWTGGGGCIWLRDAGCTTLPCARAATHLGARLAAPTSMARLTIALPTATDTASIRR